MVAGELRPQVLDEHKGIEISHVLDGAQDVTANYFAVPEAEDPS